MDNSLKNIDVHNNYKLGWSMILNQRRGVALIIVMIVASGLSVLAFGLAFRATVRMKISELNIHNAQAYHLAIGGIEKGKVFLVEYVLSDDPEIIAVNVAKTMPFAAHLSEEEKLLLSEEKEIKQRLEYMVLDESGFININKANPVNLMKLDRFDETMVSTIIDWIDQDSDLSFSQSAESDYYMQQNPPYTAKNEEITHLRELLFLRDVEIADYTGLPLDLDLGSEFTFFGHRYDTNAHSMLTGMINLFSVHGDGKLNINTAPANILSTLPGIDIQVAETLVEYRMNLASDECLSNFDFFNEIDFSDIQKDSITNNCSFDSNIFRIYSFGEYEQSYCCLIAVVEYAEDKLKTLSLERLF